MGVWYNFHLKSHAKCSRSNFTCNPRLGWKSSCSIVSGLTSLKPPVTDPQTISRSFSVAGHGRQTANSPRQTCIGKSLSCSRLRPTRTKTSQRKWTSAFRCVASRTRWRVNQWPSRTSLRTWVSKDCLELMTLIGFSFIPFITRRSRLGRNIYSAVCLSDPYEVKRKFRIKSDISFRGKSCVAGKVELFKLYPLRFTFWCIAAQNVFYFKICLPSIFKYNFLRLSKAQLLNSPTPPPDLTDNCFHTLGELNLRVKHLWILEQFFERFDDENIQTNSHINSLQVSLDVVSSAAHISWIHGYGCLF